MSYFDLPRLHFSGSFFTDPSTVNNDSTHYKVDVTRPSPWQAPMGQHRFQIKPGTTRITSITALSDSSSDPLIGAELMSTDVPSPAKIVDLDVCQQAIPTLYGLSLALQFEGGSLTGKLQAPELNGCYFTRVLPTRSWGSSDQSFTYGDDGSATGCFQARMLVADADWPKAGISAVLDALKTQCARDVATGAYMLSVRMVVDGYQNVRTDTCYLTGRVVGAIGPVLHVDEPELTPGERWLEARPFQPNPKQDPWPWYWPFLYRIPFRLDDARKKLVIDFANGVTMDKFRGDPVDLGNLSVAVGTGGARTSLGQLGLNGFQYANNALIVELPLTDAQLAAARSAPLSLTTDKPDIGPPVLWSEAADGVSWAVDRRSFRLSGRVDSPASSVDTRVIVRKWGAPLSGCQLQPEIVSVVTNTPGNTSPNGVANTESALGAISAQLSATDARGAATLSLKVRKDPGTRTALLDGQLYFIYINGPAGRAPTDVYYEHQVSLVAFSAYVPLAQPAWSDVQALMAPYAKLFPAMKQLVDLTDQHSFMIYAKNPPWSKAFGVSPEYERHGMKSGAIPFMMTLPVDDPRYMPLTRDLSPERVQTVLNWILAQQRGQS